MLFRSANQLTENMQNEYEQQSGQEMLDSEGRSLPTKDDMLQALQNFTEMHATLLAPRVLQLDLCTQAGTYVKEFVHSDFGRTHPSVGSLLGCEADIMQLDVMGLLDSHIHKGLDLVKEMGDMFATTSTVAELATTAQ